MSAHRLLLRDRPFNAIKSGLKNIEVRANKKIGDLDYSKIQAGDQITFINQSDGSLMDCSVEYVRHYKSVRDLLSAEGVENTLSSGGSLEDGIRSIEGITDYKKTIRKSGIFAYKIELFNQEPNL